MYAAAQWYKINDEPVNMTIGYDLTSSDQQTNLAAIQTKRFIGNKVPFIHAIYGKQATRLPAGKQGNKARKAGKQATRLKYYA